jgi:hypothetical protein
MEFNQKSYSPVPSSRSSVDEEDAAFTPRRLIQLERREGLFRSLLLVPHRHTLLASAILFAASLVVFAVTVSMASLSTKPTERQCTAVLSPYCALSCPKFCLDT